MGDVTGEEGGGTGMDTGAGMTGVMEAEEMITGVGGLHLHIGGEVAGADLDHFHQGGTDIDRPRDVELKPQHLTTTMFTLILLSVFH